MGNCWSSNQDEKKAKAHSERIDNQLQILAHQEQATIKILLLGAGESGKSTLVKQMKIIHDDGFTEKDLLGFKPIVMENLLASMKFVLNGMLLLRINLENPHNRLCAQTILSCQHCYDNTYTVLSYIANSLHSLYRDMGIRRAIARGYEYELNDSAVYYFEHMERICHPSYCPTNTDVLRARVRTQGITETCFKISGMIFRVFDVGGQRSERRKWIQCFDDVKGLLFVVALSGYDMTLYEDPSVNRLEESLKLFKQIVNNRFFTTTSTILFLNKMDLFKDKIQYSGRHLKYYFQHYTGADYDVQSAASYVKYLFMHTIQDPCKVVYPHFTTATDTSNIQVIFNIVTDTIIKENLRTVQFL